MQQSQSMLEYLEMKTGFASTPKQWMAGMLLSWDTIPDPIKGNKLLFFFYSYPHVKESPHRRERERVE